MNLQPRRIPTRQAPPSAPPPDQNDSANRPLVTVTVPVALDPDTGTAAYWNEPTTLVVVIVSTVMLPVPLRCR
jgi:hypothetical protein